MKKIMQFRYEGFGNDSNYPEFADYNAALASGNIFKDYPSISCLGIQAPEGMRFYLNGSVYPITVGKTGIYELDLDGVGRINKIQFNAEDISKYFPKKQEHNNRLLVDIIYEGGSSV